MENRDHIRVHLALALHGRSEKLKPHQLVEGHEHQVLERGAPEVQLAAFELELRPVDSRAVGPFFTHVKELAASFLAVFPLQEDQLNAPVQFAKAHDGIDGGASLAAIPPFRLVQVVLFANPLEGHHRRASAGQRRFRFAGDGQHFLHVGVQLREPVPERGRVGGEREEAIQAGHLRAHDAPVAPAAVPFDLAGTKISERVLAKRGEDVLSFELARQMMSILKQGFTRALREKLVAYGENPGCFPVAKDHVNSVDQT